MNNVHSTAQAGYLDAMSRTSLVTGANGFVGRHLVAALVARGDRVIAADIRLPSRPDDGATWIHGDITDASQLRTIVEGCDVIFHNASAVHTRQNAASTVWRVNHEGTKNVLDAAAEAGVPRLVYVSSASVVYEGRDIENGDESLPYARTEQAPYAASKIAAEREVLNRNGAELRTCAIRPHVVFGPGDTRFLPAILARARAGRLKAGVGLVDKLSDFTYIDNLVDALVAADEKLEAEPDTIGGQAYFVTNGEPRAFWAFVGDVLRELSLPPIRGRVPYRLAYAVAALAEAWDAWRGRELVVESGLSRFAIRYMCTHHYFSVDKAARDLGYVPRVDLREGIARTCAALR